MIVKLLLKVGRFGTFGFPQTVYHARKTWHALSGWKLAVNIYLEIDESSQIHKSAHSSDPIWQAQIKQPFLLIMLW